MLYFSFIVIASLYARQLCYSMRLCTDTAYDLCAIVTRTHTILEDPDEY